MVVLHNKIYNPKIDYLICKQLVKTLPIGYDEDRMRKVYVDYSQVKEIYEKDLVDVKIFFEQNDIMQITNDMVEKLYKICAHEDLYLNDDIAMIIQNDLSVIAEYVNKINCQRKTLFQILFLLQYCNRRNLPIIPYIALCNNLFYALIAKENQEVESLFDKLQNRTEKYMIKHPVERGHDCIRLLRENRDMFLAETDAIKIGYYGSYARGGATEYSDFDILVIFSDEKCLPLCKRISTEFWRNIMPIEIDVSVINLSNYDTVPECIQSSIKFV